MRKHAFLPLAFLALIVLGGCITRYSSRAEQQLNAYVGQNASAVIQAMGAPAVSQRSEDGGWVYRWRGCYIDMGWHGRDWPRYCETTVRADGEGIVRHWSWRGNECPLMGVDSGCDPNFWFYR